MSKTLHVLLLSSLVTLTGCAATERVTLLPQAEKSSAVVVTHRVLGRESLVDRPYHEANITRFYATVNAQSADYTQQRYADVLQYTPKQPKKFMLYFNLGTDQLTTESNSLLPSIVAEVVNFPAAEIVIIGHTDRIGTEQFNDQLSLQRATVMRDILIRAGIVAEQISMAGRGEREPLVPTNDEVDEPRNRRVEIKLR